MMFILYINILLLILFIHPGVFAMTATAVVYGDGSNTTCGILTFFQSNSNTSVNVTGTLSGLNTTGAHGFHVHTYSVSEPSPNCSIAGGHFNPYNTSHGPPTANILNRHVGDLGNITVDANGTVYVNITDSIIQLYNITQSIINRTIVIHAMPDDGGSTGINNSNVTGNSGNRIFCGLIKLVSDISNTTTTTIPTTTTTTITVITTKSMALLNIKPSTSILFMTIIFGYIFFY